MSYQVLARKWRPKSFTEVVGQEHVLKILSNALSLGRVHHAYLFSGTRGVGKTSIARLLAKGLNCESGITATPCGVCDNCRDIEQGRFVDLLEIDAASRTKVEDTREILDNIQYLPTKGRFKVYLIDEVHMLSRSSFNALLKTLEEPPEHVKFLLATTDPQKLPITILSRCLHLHLNVLDTSLISGQLAHILQVEQIDSEQKAIQLLAKAANGSMRDALSLTDQAIALGNGQVDAKSVGVMLGTLDKAIPFSLVEALYQGDGNALMQQIEVAAIQGADWDSLLAESITLLHQIALLQVVPTALGDYSDNEERIRFLAQYMAPNDVQLFYQILLMGRKELAFAPDKKIGAEMSFLRALAFMPKANNAVMPVAQTTPQPLPQVQPQIEQQVQPQVPTQVEPQVQSEPMPQLPTQNSLQTPVQTNYEPTVSAVVPATAPIIDIDSTPASTSTTTTTTTTIPAPTLLPQFAEVPKPEVQATVQPQLQSEQQQSQPQEQELLIPDEAPSITKNILEMRMQLMKGEQNTKKSEPVEVTQPQTLDLPQVQARAQTNLSATELLKSQTVQNIVNNNLIDDNQDDESDEEIITAENYQWQSSGLLESKEDLSIDTKSFKQSLGSDKAPEMTRKLIAEMAQKDSWCGEIESLDIPPLVKQIAVNSFVEQTGEDAITLHMRSSVKHLIKSSMNITKLEHALSTYRQRKIKLQVVVDDNQENKTPLEMREELYQQKLEQVKQKIHQDDKVAMICQYFEAQIDEASIRPV